MVITQLEARVTADQWDALKRVFHEANQQLPAAIDQSFLIQHSTEQELWRILTVWRSREALDAYRASVQTPGGVLMFRSAGAEPTLTMFDVIEHGQHH